MVAEPNGQKVYGTSSTNQDVDGCDRQFQIMTDRQCWHYHGVWAHESASQTITECSEANSIAEGSTATDTLVEGLK